MAQYSCDITRDRWQCHTENLGQGQELFCGFSICVFSLGGRGHWCGVFMSSNSERAQAPGGRRLKHGDTQRKGCLVIVVKSKAMQRGSGPVSQCVLCGCPWTEDCQWRWKCSSSNGNNHVTSRRVMFSYLLTYIIVDVILFRSAQWDDIISRLLQTDSTNTLSLQSMVIIQLSHFPLCSAMGNNVIIFTLWFTGGSMCVCGAMFLHLGGDRRST